MTNTKASGGQADRADVEVVARDISSCFWPGGDVRLDFFYSICLRCRNSFNVSIRLDETSCPEKGGFARDKLRA